MYDAEFFFLYQELLLICVIYSLNLKKNKEQTIVEDLTYEVYEGENRKEGYEQYLSKQISACPYIA